MPLKKPFFIRFVCPAPLFWAMKSSDCMGNILLRCEGEIIDPVDSSKGGHKSNALHIYHGLDKNLAKLNAHKLEGAGNAEGKCAG